MRTKTLLLTAAALLTAGYVSTQAQPVYSQNVVGYASVATPNAYSYYMITVPFAVGVSNGANEVFGTTLPDYSQVLTWNVAQQKYVSTLYDSTQAPLGPWFLPDDTTPTTPPTLPVGQGFFLLPAGSVTNVFAGTIPVNVGTSNKMSLTNAYSYYMVASVVPYGGAVTNGNSSTGGMNLNGLPDYSQVLTWDSTLQKYVSTLYDSTQAPLGPWFLSDDTTPTAVPSVNVGQGFFILPAGSYTWTTGL